MTNEEQNSNEPQTGNSIKADVSGSKLTVEILKHSDEEAQIFMGGDSRNLSWQEYID